MRLFFAVMVLLAVTFSFTSAAKDVRVKGYFRKNGTYVAPHYRSSPNSTTLDNYSTRGNYNPYTGKSGTVNPYGLGAIGRQHLYTAPAIQPVPAAIPPAATMPATADWRNFGKSLASASANTNLVVPEPIEGGGPESRSLAEQTAFAEVHELGQALRRTDPDFDMKIAILGPRIRQIQSTLPPEQWAGAVANAWAALQSYPRAATVGAGFASGRGHSQECREAQSRAQDLYDEASNLAKCAAAGDLTDDCSRQARRTKNAAESYEDAISAISGACGG